MRWTTKKTPREQKVAGQLRAASRFYRFLWEIRDELFADGFEDLLLESYQPRGQEPCPAAMLAMVLLLQRYDGLSDADAVDAAENDRRWQLVLGTLGDDTAPFGQGSLVRFRTRMIAQDLDKKLVDRTVELAKKSGAFGWKKLRVALDSSPLHGAGRVEDTWNLIGRAMAKVVHAVSTMLQLEEADVIEQAKLSVLSASSFKAALDIDWTSKEEQGAALQMLLAQVARLETWVERRAQQQTTRPPLKDALELLERVVGQDLDPEPPDGKAHIADAVAPDRVISIGDPQMRHGRKSKSKRFDGYKRHIGLAHGFVIATAIEPANVPEYIPAQRLLAQASRHGSIQCLDIDRGYLPSPAVHALHRAGVTVRSRAWRTTREDGLFSKEDFRIDLRRKLVTCPAGKTTKIPVSGRCSFAVADCGKCRLKPKCTTFVQRSVRVHAIEDLLLQLRKNARTRAGRAELRERTVVEHRLARIGAIQGIKARYRGTRKNELDLNRVAAIANLQALAALRIAA